MDVQYQVAGSQCEINYWYTCGAEKTEGRVVDVRSRDCRIF